VSGSDILLNEAREIMARSRDWLANQPAENPERSTTKQEKHAMDISDTPKPELTPQAAAQLYTTGKTVYEIAVMNGITYSKARKLIVASGTPIRNASDRLKGRTRKKNA
jgi:hypothetical protein